MVGLLPVANGLPVFLLDPLPAPVAVDTARVPLPLPLPLTLLPPLLLPPVVLLTGEDLRLKDSMSFEYPCTNTPASCFTR